MRPPNKMYRTHWLVFGAVVLLAVTALAADPAWWTSRGAVNSSPPNPYAVVNQGQLKAFTARAVQELDTDLAGFGGAGTTLDGMLDSWQQDYATHGYGNTSNPSYPYKPTDFQAVNVGQLKYVASLVGTRLVEVGYLAVMPTWIVPDPGTDNSAATIGQVKTVFNFNLTLDSNNDGLPDWWEQLYSTTGTLNPNADDDGDGLTNLQEWQLGTNPLVKDNPTIHLVAQILIH